MHNKDLLYCRSCGAFINFKGMSFTLMTCPPTREYKCEQCSNLQHYSEEQMPLVSQELANGKGS